MIFSDNFSQLAQTLQDAGDSDAQLRLTLLHHFSELIQQLTCPLVADPSQAQEDSASSVESETAVSDQAPSVVAEEAPLVLSEYGDAFPTVRLEALQVFDTRRLDQEEYVVFWLDAFRFWGRPLLVCKAATLDGSRRILGFAECGLRDSLLLEQLFRDFLDRGLDLASGLLCITSEATHLSQVFPAPIASRIKWQQCQMHTREQVISYLSEADRVRVRGEITRAFALPDPALARAALLRIHSELQTLNRSAAQWLMHDLALALTLHHSGLYEQLSPSLRSTRCVVRAGQQLSRRLRGIRHWLPPASRRAQFALLFLEMETHLRRLAHASYLSPMRSALFSEREPASN